MTQTAATVSDLRENLREVLEKIESAARKVGRNSNDVTLTAVSKTHPVEVLQAALEAGANCFGENRVQEAEAKIAALGSEAVQWHLIGNLQANKARKAVKLFDLIHSLDSIELAVRLERICEEEQRQKLPVLIQVDLAGEATKSGIAESELPALIETLQDCRHLQLQGLMVLPPFFDDAERVRPYFQRLREIRNDLQRQNVFAGGRGELSMGMSGDFEVAVEEGATIVRVGTAIFGARAKYKAEI